MILPGAAFTEESGIFVNTEGRPQMANRAGFPPGEARENWAILRALSAQTGTPLPFNSLAELRVKMFDAVPHLARIDLVPDNAWTAAPMGDMGEADFPAPSHPHYQSNPIARASQVMAELAKLSSAGARPMAAE